MVDITAINVSYKDKNVGAVSYNAKTKLGAFEYSPKFIKTGIELSPLKMPLSDRIYTFPNLNSDTFKGLSGLIADSLPDDFGNAVMNAWLSMKGRSSSDITPLERLQYTGQRGMGALTYSPATRLKHMNSLNSIEIESLVSVAQSVLNDREAFQVSLHQEDEDKEAMLSLLSVGMSAGGARPKAVVAFDKDFKNVKSGQVDVPNDFTHYLMKFDGVSEHNKNKETFGDPLGYGAMEYVYYQMATLCGVDMMPCKLLNEGERRHFITQRFDRIGNEKVHVQTLNGIAHVDYKKVGSYSYGELLGTARALDLSPQEGMQIFKRMVFNVIARNHDDHAKNFAFLLGANNQWRLAPAYDLAYSYKPDSSWVSQHWMTLNGKRDNFTREDFYAFEALSPLFSRRKIDVIVDETIERVSTWRALATQQAVPKTLIDVIESNLRLYI
ncbi:type II toxin-antitoxin system HipA family toxin [Pseudocolwellia sp. AS88]|uniref:type II toxin-antitoxin system HipA family toxin n=1 Tax=Pseudocolwellia sp. AS88 TaxID=3063958 RepID=UPI0026EF6C0E|nr:type II toxin-antitoxin system HipA family toxin [Pseudocolwellia sp. AS88]MDO7085558.1 type II toxin-antitoxin system HipA family toxin [Pseudocolwellia sp. AS88]